MTTLLRAALIGFGVAALVGVASAVGIGSDAARRASDVLWPTNAPAADVAVVVVDQRAQAEHGAWPWPRSLQADLVERVAAAAPARVGLDVIVGAGSGDPGSTDRLARALTDADAVAAVGFTAVVRGERGLLIASEPVRPAESIAEAVPLGHALAPADADGTVRSVPLVVQTPEGTLLPSLSLLLAASRDNESGAESPVIRPGSVQVGTLAVPTEAGAALRIAWTLDLASPGPHVYSAADVLAGAVGGDELGGKIVLVGVADVTIGDTHVTPLQPGATTPGVIVQAQALHTILARTWVSPAPWWSAPVVVALLGTAIALLIDRSRVWIGIAVTAVMIAGWVGVAVAVLPLWGMLLDLVRVPIGLAGCAVAAGAFRLVRERRARARASELFARYVSPSVAQRLLDTRGERALDAGIRTYVAVVFCDIRSFTPMTAHSDADDVRRVLDEYYEYACARIFAAGGTVMQFVGDEVFAVFGVPDAQQDAVDRARAAAFALVDDEQELHDRLAAKGLPSVRFGVGVHAGQVVAAVVGTDARRQYAVVGDAVNVGARLCAAAEAGEVVVSTAAGAPVAETLERLRVKGKDEPIVVFRHRGRSPDVGAQGARVGHVDAPA